MLHRKIGIVGYGHLGQFLVEQIQQADDLQLAFVWNRSLEPLRGKVNDEFILDDLSQFATRDADLIVEVAHPSISEKYGAAFLQHSDYLVGSPTALANIELESQLRASVTVHGLYIPTGAFWGGEDIRKMADRDSLQALKITMTKHPDCFKLVGALKMKNELVKDELTVLYDGPVRGLCPLAPNNVNTMAAASIAAHNLGFDGVQGSIVADPSLLDWHIVEVEVWGPGDIKEGTAFHCKTVRRNPSKLGNVTGTATFGSFFSSLQGANTVLWSVSTWC